MQRMPAYLTTSHDPWVVAASLLIATLASYVTLDLSLRVRSHSGSLNVLWWSVGTLVMGTGIWSMHFVGMLGFLLPVPLGFTGLLTLSSWLAAVAASGIALWVASRAVFSWGSVAVGAGAMGLAICGMHYLGMGALDMSPGIVWDMGMVAMSVAIAFGASAAALAIFHFLRRVDSERRFPLQLLAAVVMGAAIGGMHYTGMAAAQFPEGSVCLSANALGGNGMMAIVALASCMLLLGTLFASILEARLQVVARELSASLQQSNAQLQVANEELRHRAFSDTLTGLPNRLLFEQRLQHALRRLDRNRGDGPAGQLAVLFVDLDGFKPVNDSYGHAAGDQLLQATAQRLQAECRGGDTVARVGGDEFLLLLEDLGGAEDCVRVLDGILRALAQPFEVQGRRLQIACSIGAVMHPMQGERDKLIAQADAAMYAAKRAGGSRYALFEPHMKVETDGQLELQEQLRHALGAGELELYYQPKIDGRRQCMSGVEALVRWNHPTLGLVPPVRFIPMAEKSGLILPLGRWVIEEACRQVAAWGRQGIHMHVAVNLSPLQLEEAGLAEGIDQALRRHGVCGSQLICEITESAALRDLRQTQQVFEELMRLGVKLSIDDFGTGYSSLSQLRDLPARQLKVDRSFVMDLETSADARAVVEAVIHLGHALKLSVVAEGVETEGQRDILLRMGCDELQGYFFGRPMQAQDVPGWSLLRPLVPLSDVPAPIDLATLARA